MSSLQIVPSVEVVSISKSVELLFYIVTKVVSEMNKQDLLFFSPSRFEPSLFPPSENFAFSSKKHVLLLQWPSRFSDN